MNVTFEEIFQTVCRGQNDPLVVRVFERLGEGTRRVVQHLVYMDFFAQGISFLFEGFCVSSVFFFSEGRHRDHREYKGVFPGNLRFGALRDAVRNGFDQLLACDEGGGEMFGIPVEPWDEFAYEGHVLHVEYSAKGEKVVMVTISSGEGRVESPPLPSENASGLMTMLRQWFKPKNPIGIRGHFDENGQKTNDGTTQEEDNSDKEK